MNCSAEETRWLMEWAAFLVVIVMFAAAGAWRWAMAVDAEGTKPAQDTTKGGVA